MRVCTGNQRFLARFGFGFLLALSCSAAFAQNPVLKTRTKEEREEQFNVTHRITMNVQVTDAAGKPVSDLRAEDFRLYDNQQARKIAAFHPIDGEALRDATEVLILLDAVNTPAPALDKEKSAIFKYLTQSRKPFAFPIAFVLWFNGHLNATTATTDRNAIGRAFVKLTKNLHSNACDGEESATQPKVAVSKDTGRADPATCRAVHFKDSIAVLDGIAQQQRTTGGRTLLIWMGSGWPVISNQEFQHLTPKQQRDYNREFVTILHDLRAAQVTIYSIAPGDGLPQGRGSDSNGKTMILNSPGSASFPRIAVDEFARRTGGRVIDAATDITGDLLTCIRDAEWYYALSFNAPPAQNGAGEIHSLKIEVNRPGVEVRTMDSYYSAPE